MKQAAILKLVSWILKEMFEHGHDIIPLLQAKKVEDQELYLRMPRKRQMELLRARRLLGRP